MNRTWQLQDAKNHFSEVVEQALRHGPQVITRHGKETAVVLSLTEYKRLAKPKVGLVDFFKRSPLRSAKLDTKRSKDPSREVTF